jgi:hypothetical protein
MTKLAANSFQKALRPYKPYTTNGIIIHETIEGV